MASRHSRCQFAGVYAQPAPGDSGAAIGAALAAHSYRQALAVYGDLDIPRRIAQLELSLTVVTEMGGELQAAARGHTRLAGDERLSGRDRARARLWIGTALSKDGQHDHAARVMTEAGREFENLGEAEDWSVAQQKLALAHRGAGNLALAQRLIALASASGTADTPMQKVRHHRPGPHPAHRRRHPDPRARAARGHRPARARVRALPPAPRHRVHPPSDARAARLTAIGERTL
jgi:hypothetical protein